MDKEKICAVVVTYNRKDLLMECIGALRNQTRKLDCILVVNNDSTDGTKEWLDEQKDLNVIHQENLGGAGGFHNGMKWAYENGYDWIWCMDDDAVPLVNSLFELAKYTSNTIVAITPMVIDEKFNIVYEHRGNFTKKYLKSYSVLEPTSGIEYSQKMVQVELSTFVGMLINSTYIKNVGYPQKELFIHNDDIEYCLRIINYGEIIMIPSSKIIHKCKGDQDKIFVDFLGKKIFRKNYKRYWVTYYTLRNFFIVLINHNDSFTSTITSIIYTLLNEITKILLFDDYKAYRIKIIILSIKDTILNKYNRTHKSLFVK